MVVLFAISSFKRTNDYIIIAVDGLSLVKVVLSKNEFDVTNAISELVSELSERLCSVKCSLFCSKKLYGSVTCHMNETNRW